MPRESTKNRKSTKHKRYSGSSSDKDTPVKKKMACRAEVSDIEMNSTVSKQIDIPTNQPEWFMDFSTSLKDMSKKLDCQVSKLDNQSSQITDLINQVKELNNTNNFLEEKICLVEEVAQEATSKVNGLIKIVESLEKENQDLHLKITAAENYSKKNNLKLHNVAENQRESQSQLMDKLANILGAIDINLSNILVDNIHRLPASSAGPRPIIVKFASFLDRSMIWNNRHLLKERNIKVYISEHFDIKTEKNIRKLLPIKKAASNLKMKTRMMGDNLIINSKTYTIHNLQDLPSNLQPASLATREEGNYIFFFNEASQFSNFHPCNFLLDRVSYNCVEQYIQNKKAILFRDSETATRIMDTTSPQVMKALGAKVKNFEKGKWGENMSEIVKEAIRAKFSQNADLKKTLLASGSKTLVEAAPRDSTWGIGIYLHDQNIIQKKDEWGKNLQGKTLMEIRGVLSN